MKPYVFWKSIMSLCSLFSVVETMSQKHTHTHTSKDKKNEKVIILGNEQSKEWYIKYYNERQTN